MHDDLGRWLEPERCRRHQEAVEAFWAGRGGHMVSLHAVEPAYWRRQDETLWVQEAVEQLWRQAALAREFPGSVSLPAVTPVHGGLGTAAYWGAMKDVEPVTGQSAQRPAARTLDEALELTPLPADHPGMDASQAVRLYRLLSDRFETDQLWLRLPDLQGVLSTASQIVDQEELLVGMHTEPGKVHALLERVADHLVQTVRYVQGVAGGRICGNSWPFTYFPDRLGVSFTEDLMPLLSAEMYQEFGLPGLRRFEREFGGLHIHCCGKWGHHVRTFAESGLSLAAMEYHHPYTTLAELEPLAGRTVLVPFFDARQEGDGFADAEQYYRHVLREGDPRFRFWLVAVQEWWPCRELVAGYDAWAGEG
ncbi:MAG: hypothetical protein IT441_06260 [Phycisphaeraceae bacterium]|nr:hypothetical protein [Phycisphaeraceae bacterium]